MRNVTYFPPYSQDENMVTNAVLLLLAQVNRLAPSVFSGLLTRLTDDEYFIGPTFKNQIRHPNAQSVPDALIRQIPFEIYLETKKGNDLDCSQICQHFDTIKKIENVEGSSVLLGLTRMPIDREKLGKLQERGMKKKVRFFTTTFSELADILEKSSDEFRLELNAIIEEFRAFIQELKLMPDSDNRLLINPCGNTYEQNCYHHIYYDQPTRSKIFCKYLGLYKEKSVSRIGEVLAVVNARTDIESRKVEITKNHPLSWCNALHEPTEQEKDRILEIARKTGTHKEERYYIVEKFVECTFKKKSKHGVQGHRYFSLDGEDGIIRECFADKLPSIQEVANALSAKTWE
ncbi:MAG: hypothetical protein OXC62_03025 [Aestuariivita sp.]|nr:hypothetical protein [Aestuariivita sp.]